MWTTDWLAARHAVREAIPSWCPLPGSEGVVRVEIQGRAGGRETAWYPMCSWSAAPGRTSCSGGDDDAEVAVDTLAARTDLDAVRVRVELGQGARLARLSVSLWDGAPGTGGLGLTAPELDVPELSQQAYAGRVGDVGGGGSAWCSPACVAMVLAYCGVEVAGDAVVAAARGTYDESYGGCGNWAFSTAYAALQGADAVVTRLASLDEAGGWLARGVAPVLSIRAAPGELDGFPLAAGTTGHLLVLRGLDAGGRAIVNDPAAPPGAVRRLYDRGQLERAWRNGSGGAAYLVAPHVGSGSPLG